MKTRKAIIDKKTGELRNIGSFGVPTALFSVLFHARAAKWLWITIGSALSKFFYPQFAVKFGWKKIKVVHVDNELDYKVPFAPLEIKIYLQFLNLWISPLSFIIKRFGCKKAIPYCAEMLKNVNNCYRRAYDMYGFMMSTTNRPMGKVDKEVAANFRMIRIWDPHYMCVPSLHIALVTLAYTFFRKAFAELGLSEEESKVYNAELYANAISIAETVLYVKQHSVNCIPAALYMMRCIIPTYMDEADVEKFISDLFEKSDDIARDDIIAIRNHISNLYAQFNRESQCLRAIEKNQEPEVNWSEPVRKWIVDYKAYIPQ
ncbi:MAG: hypothetical protein K5839_00370 [Treponemataceae bacterium]|nr:hypothetical protein [Treponemataceae bacterium]